MNSLIANVLECRIQLAMALRKAVSHLRESGNYPFLNNEPEVFTAFQLADLIESLSTRIAGGDREPESRLWIIFAPTGAWDDASDNSRLANEIFGLLYRLQRRI